MVLERFIEFLEREAGEAVRAAGWYEGDEFEVVYLREDLDRDRAIRVAADLHAQITWDWKPPASDLETYFGPQLASVGMYRESIVLHLPEAEETGVVVTLDVDVARNLHGFITDCQDVLGFDG